MATLTKTPTQMARHDLANGNWRNCGGSSSSSAYSGVGSSTADGKTYYRGLMNFDISSIPATATINSASLKFYVTGGTNTSAKAYFRAKLINKSWTSAKPSWGSGATSENHTSNYILTTNSGYAGVTGAGFYTIDITASLMSTWVKNQSSYYGLALVADNETTDSSTGYIMDGAKIASLKHVAHMTYSGGSSYYPTLTVNYTPINIGFNGNQVSTIKFNGNTVTSLVYNGTKIF